MSQREFSQLDRMCGYEKNENRFDWNFLPEDRRGINKVAPFTTTSHKEACWTEKKLKIIAAAKKSLLMEFQSHRE